MDVKFISFNDENNGVIIKGYIARSCWTNNNKDKN